MSTVLEVTEFNARNSHANEKKALECSISVQQGRKPAEKETAATVFINHAVCAWHDGRKRWVGDQSRRTNKIAKDPIISWTTTYDELLLTNQPFSEPIPLPEMVDFLVDIWHDEGLFD